MLSEVRPEFFMTKMLKNSPTKCVKLRAKAKMFTPSLG